jgi:hypothetical protein
MVSESSGALNVCRQVVNSRQTDPESKQHPKFHVSLHLQAPDEPYGVYDDCEVDEHTECFDGYPPM